MRALALALAVVALTGCPKSPGSSSDGGDAGTPFDAGTPLDSGTPDAGLPPYDRTLITRPLMPTSALNLLRDPLVGGDGASSYGQFRALFVGGPTLPLKRTFQSVSPVGGAVSIEELRNLPTDAGTSTSLRVLSSFLGGAGNYQASIWLSAGDVNAAPVPFAQASPSLVVTLIDNEAVTQTTLVAGQPQHFGAREWVQLTTPAPLPMPHGGWLMVTLSDFSLTLQLAAPEVTASSEPVPHLSCRRPVSDDDRAALRQARQLDAPPGDHPIE